MKNKTYSLLTEISQMALEYFAGKYNTEHILLTEAIANRIFEVTEHFEKKGFKEASIIREVVNRARSKTIGELQKIFNLSTALKSPKK